METRWLFHRMEMPLDGVPHFDTLHAARRLWKPRDEDPMPKADAGCRRSSARCSTCGGSATCRGFEIPSRFFQFLRTRRSASARAGARAQPAGSRVAGGGHRAGGAAGRRRRRRMSTTDRRRWRSAASTSAPGSSIAPRAATAAPRRATGRRGEVREPVSARPALPPRTPVQRGGRRVARDRRARPNPVRSAAKRDGRRR